MMNYIFNLENFKSILSRSFQNSFNIKGRTSRKEWTAYTIYWFVLSLIPVFSLIFVPATFSIDVRRYHDVGKSGKLYLLLRLLSVILSVLCGILFAEGSDLAIAMGIVVAIIFVVLTVYLIIILCSAGEVGPNKYGYLSDDDIGNSNTGVYYQRDSSPVNQRNKQSFNQVPYDAGTPLTPKRPIHQGEKAGSQTGKTHCPKCNQVVDESWSVCPFCSQNLSTVKHYEILFVDEDGILIKSENVLYGKMPTPPKTLAKQDSAQFHYEFVGWSPEIHSVTGSEKYTAMYKVIEKKYRVTFVSENGTVIESTAVPYGEDPVAPTAPEKPATDQYEYEFAGWTPEIKRVLSGDAVYTAVYTAKEKSIQKPVPPSVSKTERASTESLCSKCGKAVHQNWILCPFCGQDLSAKRDDGENAPAKVASAFSCCPNCGADVDPDWIICPDCGTNLRAEQNVVPNVGSGQMAPHETPVFTCCPNCGADVEPDWVVCPDCGENLKD